MSDQPVRVAWCNILYLFNGGKIPPYELALLSSVEPFKNAKLMEEVEAAADEKVSLMPARGMCNEPHDCSECEMLKDWLSALSDDGWNITWECIDCVSSSKSTPRVLPGYYTSGRDPSIKDPYNGGLNKPGKPPFNNVDPDAVRHNYEIIGCMKCHAQSSLLQLVLRRP